MKFCWTKKKVDIKETHGENTRSVDNANNKQMLNDVMANLKRNVISNEKAL